MRLGGVVAMALLSALAACDGDGALDGGADGAAAPDLAAGDLASGDATVLPALVLTPAAFSMPANQTAYPLTVSGGVPPIAFAVTSGPGSIDASGAFTPGSTPGTATVTATDGAGQTATATIEVVRVTTNGTVFAVAHVGRSLYVGGSFTAVHAYPAHGLIALGPSGAPQLGCDPKAGFDGVVQAMAQSGNAIYAGGAFTRYQGQPANRLAKIDATTCALDSTFSPPSSNGFDNIVYTLAVAGTSLYVGGDFTAYRGVTGSASHLAKLDLATGALDTAFSPVAANGFGGAFPTVIALAVSGTSLYAGGSFDSYRGVADSAHNLAKLDLATGALDTTFSPAGATANGFDASVFALAVSGSSLYAGGAFTAYRGVAGSASHLAKLDLATGALDTTFSPPGATANGVDKLVDALAVSATSLYVGGKFRAYRGVADSAHDLAKLDLTSGALDTTFSPPGATANGFPDVRASVAALALHGASLYVGGYFTGYRDRTGVADGLAKLDAASGALDDSFGVAGNSERGFAGQGGLALAFVGETLFAGGDFVSWGGFRARRVAKLDDATFVLDASFSAAGPDGFDRTVNALASDGSALYAGGSFSAYRGVANAANGLAKLDLASGALDTTFGPAGATANGFGTGTVNAVALAGGALYVGGNFSTYRGVADSAHNLAKLDVTTGALDTTFSPPGAGANGFDDQVFALAATGASLYVGGLFGAYRGVADSAHGLAKLDLASGALDTTFSPAGMNGFSGGAVRALAIAGASLYAGGFFSAYRGVADSAHGLAKLDLASGALDTTFSPVGASANGFDGGVLALVVSSTALHAGGAFNSYRGAAGSARNLARLDPASGALDTTFSPAGANGTDSAVWSLAVGSNALYAGGGYTRYRGRTAASLQPIDATSGALE